MAELAQPEIVVKVGGSLSKGKPTLRSWLDVIGSAQRAIVVVPGGGAFADGVRDAQERFGFDDATGHSMAVLAMHQMGLMVCGLAPRLRPARSFEAVDNVLAQGCIPVFLPLAELDRDASFPKVWEATSDAIAAWTAERLGGLHLALIKSRAAPPGINVDELAEDGLIDRVTPNIVCRARLAVDIIGPGDKARLAALIDARSR